MKRNNDREWFRARKDQYEQLLRAPMIDLVERLAGDLRSFAPDLVASPKTSSSPAHHPEEVEALLSNNKSG